MATSSRGKGIVVPFSLPEARLHCSQVAYNKSRHRRAIFEKPAVRVLMTEMDEMAKAMKGFDAMMNDKDRQITSHQRQIVHLSGVIEGLEKAIVAVGAS
jgi:hypothetical protein